MPPTGADDTFGNRLSLPLRLVAFFVTGCANDDTPKSQFESEYLRLIESDIAESKKHLEKLFISAVV